ncbi:MAG: RidA family protein [Mycobacterium sp.]|nr:RidA family protein [Mycobacterium sp.]MBV9721278.1 RidA family protein [Mycobacterium sp.]
MTVVEYLNPESAAAPAGKYSHLSITSENARIATFAGQIATTTSSQMPAAAADQARLVFAAIEALLASQGAAPRDLIRLLTLIVGRDTLTEFNTVRDEIYTDWFPDGAYPANTVAIVAGLAAESILIEIEGSFVCPLPANPPPGVPARD